jgi:CDP-ribitol ribitolphosphotransferase
LNPWEFRFASAVLRVLGFFFRLMPLRHDHVVLATARVGYLEGNLAFIHSALLKMRPALKPILLLEPYGYGLRAKVGYMLRLVRGMYHVSTAHLVVIDNAFLPVHVAPHRKGTKVVQVWHAVGALKRFGFDAPLAEPERTFLHRYYDAVIVSADAVRKPWASALRTPLDHVAALGTPRTDFFFDTAAMSAAKADVLGRYPQLRGRRVVVYAPTFRGRGREKQAAEAGLDAGALRRALPADYALVLKAHPNLPPTATDTAGFDVIVDQSFEINRLLAATDVLITDYSSSIFEWALLRRPLVLLVPDLEEYVRDPGMYLDYRTDMIGTQVRSTDEVARVLLAGDFDLGAYDSFIERYVAACDGHSSERFVDTYVADQGA